MTTGRHSPGGGPPPRSQRSSLRVNQADVHQLDEHPVPFSRIAALFRPHRTPLALVLLLIVATALVGLLPPFLIRELIDDAIPHHKVPLLLWLVGGILLVTVITQLFGVAQTWMATKIGQQVMHRLRTDLFAHLQRQPLSFFTQTRGGELQSRLTNDINAMQDVVTDSATSIASNVTTAIGTAAAMVLLSWRLSLISLVILPPAIYLTRRVARLRQTLQSKAQQTLADMQTQIEESLSISGVMLAKTTGAGPALAQRFADSSEVLTELEVESKMAGRWRMGRLTIIFAAIPAFIYLAAGLPMTGHGMTIGTLVAFTGLQSQLFRPLMGVLNVSIELTTSKALFSRIFEFIDMPVAIADPKDPIRVDLQTASGAVALHHVSLTYPGSHKKALDDVNVHVAPGERIAIVGATGSGKSTLAALLSRLHDPDSGSVTIDGVDLRDMTLTNVTYLVGVVTQETYLLHATIAENLRYAKPDATDEELEAAAKAAQVHELIMSLPDGYETTVGARGYRFSGGEKQRIALARTVLRNPKVLVLDEATSALDNRTEAAVQHALDELSKQRTTVTIAHRLSTVRDADAIVVMDAGKIVEQGTHHELMSHGGKYAALVAAQEETSRE